MGEVPESSQQEPVVDFVVAARWVGMNTILVYLMAASGAFFERAQVWVQNPESVAITKRACCVSLSRQAEDNRRETT